VAHAGTAAGKLVSEQVDELVAELSLFAGMRGLAGKGGPKDAITEG
jgi:hypothetical protein